MNVSKLSSRYYPTGPLPPNPSLSGPILVTFIYSLSAPC